MASVGADERAYRVLVENPRERDNLEDLELDKSIILKMDLQQVEWGGMDWIDLAQERDWWRAPFNAFGFHKIQGTL